MDDKHNQEATHDEAARMSRDNIEKTGEAINVHPDLNHDAEFEKRVLRKIDLLLLPILGCLYTIALVDRSNVGVARISGMAKT